MFSFFNDKFVFFFQRQIYYIFWRQIYDLFSTTNLFSFLKTKLFSFFLKTKMVDFSASRVSSANLKMLGSVQMENRLSSLTQVRTCKVKGRVKSWKVLVTRPLLEQLDHRNFKFQKSFSICFNISVSLLILHQPCWPQEFCFQATIGSASIRCPANRCWWSGWRARATDSSTCRPASPFTGTSSSWSQNREIKESRFAKFHWVV